MTKLTLQINSLEALERLIGGDTEVEMDIRRSVVDAFSKKYLKPFAEESLQDTVKEAMAPVNERLDRELNKYFSASWGGVTLSKEYKEAFNAQVKEIIKHETHEAINEQLMSATTTIRHEIENAVAHVRTYIEQYKSEDTINFMVNEVVKRKIQDILSKLP